MVRSLTAGFVLAAGATVYAQSVPPGFTVEAYGGTLTEPTTLACAPDERVFVGQLNGAVRVLKNGVILTTPFHTAAAVDYTAGSYRGLLGICLDPDFAGNGFVYIYFTTSTPASHNCVRRLKANPQNPDVSDGTETSIVDLENLGADTMHNGGAIHFGPDGKLYVAVGDNMVASDAQSLTSRFGKILRYNPDGSIPSDNPVSFQGITGSPSGVFQAIWAVGLRNPFRFAIQPGTPRLFINDVGADTWEEINDGSPGLNFGWEGGNTDGARHLPSFTDPIYQYGHSGAPPTGNAITGCAFYNPTTAMFPTSYVGKYFFSDYGAGWIYTLDPASPGTAAPFLQGASGPVDLQVGPDGGLYYLDYTVSPGVFRVSYVAVQVSHDSSPGSGSVRHRRCGLAGVEPMMLMLFLVFLKRCKNRGGRTRVRRNEADLNGRE
jgi:glucose/arabinose dehydrogenase